MKTDTLVKTAIVISTVLLSLLAYDSLRSPFEMERKFAELYPGIPMNGYLQMAVVDPEFDT